MLFKEPSNTDLLTAWQTDPSAFYEQNWEDTAYSPAEWAWMVGDAAFWSQVSGEEVQKPRQCDSWWDWLCERVKGPALKPVIHELLRLNIQPSNASLTTFLVAYQRQKTQQSPLELQEVLQLLAMPEALLYQGPLGETPMAAICAIGEPFLLRMLLDRYAEHGLKWDTPNDKQQGYWPLHFCVANRWSGGVKEMVSAGATTAGVSKFDQTPEDLAIEMGWSMFKKAVREGESGTMRVKRTTTAAPVKQAALQMDLF